MNSTIQLEIDNEVVKTKYHSHTVIDEEHLLMTTSDYNITMTKNESGSMKDLEKQLTSKKVIHTSDLPITAISIKDLPNVATA